MKREMEPFLVLNRTISSKSVGALETIYDFYQVHVYLALSSH